MMYLYRRFLLTPKPSSNDTKHASRHILTQGRGGLRPAPFSTRIKV